MIKFFRHIRKKLLSENKFSKYLIYAIGEIILVVIGILIALQINNWNEGRKERAQEQELLTQLQSEFKSNLEQLDQKNDLRNQMISASLKLLHYIDHPEKRHSDSIIKYLAHTGTAPTFDPIVNDINSSGRIQLLKNTSLKEKLARWTSEVIQVTEEEQAWLFIRNHSYMRLISKYGLKRNILNKYWKDNVSASFHLDKGTKTELDLGNSKKDIGISSILDDPEFESSVVECASYAKLTNSQAVSLRQRIVEILDLVEQDLKPADD
jgi:histidyl-tRNA synthetase